MRRVVAAAAGSLHPNTATPWAKTNIPDLLLLVEQAAHEARRASLDNIPFVRSITVGDLIALKALHGRVAPWFDKAAWAYRVFRIARNPPAGALREVANQFVGNVGGKLSTGGQQHVVQLLLLAMGRKAVALYSGRLARSAEEVRAAAAADFGDAAPALGPIRILLVGQVNAGKSSLVNALAGEVRAQQSILQQTVEMKEHALDIDGRPAVHIVETLGLSGGAGEGERLLASAARADLVFWVASVVQPARAPDTAALAVLRADFAGWHHRNPPPVRLVLTHVDRLPPGREWAPPYDLAAREGKGRSIARAMAAVARDLGFDDGAAVPVSTASPAWNVEGVWLAVASSLPEARIAQLDRLQLRRGTTLGEAWKAARTGLENVARHVGGLVG